MRNQEYCLLIKQIVESSFQVPDIAIKNRTRESSERKQLYYYLCRKFTDAPFQTIADVMGYDHATALHGVRKYTEKLESDTLFFKANFEDCLKVASNVFMNKEPSNELDISTPADYEKNLKIALHKITKEYQDKIYKLENKLKFYLTKSESRYCVIERLRILNRELTEENNLLKNTISNLEKY